MPPTRTTRPTWTALPVSPHFEPNRHTRDSVIGLVTTSAGVVGTALLLGDVARTLAVALVLVSCAVTVVRAALLRSMPVLTGDLVLRFLAPVAVAASLAPPAYRDDHLAWAAACVCVVLAASEPLLGRVEHRRRMWVSGLPALGKRPVELLPHTSAAIVAMAGTLVGALSSAFDLGSTWWALAVGVSCVVVGSMVVNRLRQVRYERRVRARIAREVARYAPEFILYNARPDDSSYQIAMWLPYFQSLGRKFIVVTRSELPAQALAELPALADVPVVCCRTSRELEDLLVPSLTSVFYVNAASGNGQMVRHAGLAHIHIGHGDSDKATSFNPTHAMYDRVFLAGEAAVARYAANGVSIPRSRLQVVGRPQVAQVERASTPVSEVAQPTVLYAPTWRGDAAATELYSLPAAERLVQGLLDRGCRVIFRPHPYSHQQPDDEAIIVRVQAMLAQDAAASGRDHVYGDAAERDLDVFGCFNASDAMVCDVSSVAVDYLMSRKPMAMYVPPTETEDFTEQYPVARGCYLIEPELSDLGAALDQLLGEDSMAQVRDQVRVSYLGDFPPETYADVFVAAVEQVITEGVAHVDAVEELDAADSDDDDHDDPRDAGPDELSPAADGTSKRARDVTWEGAVPGAAQARQSVSITVRRLADQLFDLLSALLAAASALLACTDGDRWVCFVLAVPVLAWMLWLRPPTRELAAEVTLGSFMAQRLLLALAATALVARTEAPSAALAVCSFAVLGGMLGIEVWIRPLRSAPRLRVSNLPGVQSSVWRVGLHRDVYPVSLALLVIMLATASVDLPNVVGVVLGAVVLACALALFFVDVVVVHGFDRAEEELAGAIEAYRPTFVVYFAAAGDADYQMAMWMPYFERIGRRFIVVTRTAATFDTLAAMTDAPVIVRPTLRSLDATMAPSLTTAFYVNNGLKNTHFVERRQITHVWLNHGDSEKPACFNPVHAIYDRLFVAGQAGIDRYARHGVDIPEEKFEIVGRPQIEDIRKLSDTAERGPDHVQTVLYAPTWIGPFADSAVYSLPVAIPILQELLDRGRRVIFRAHPLNYSSTLGRELVAEAVSLLAADEKKTGRGHLWGEAAEQEMTLADCFNASDAMIADVSAVLSDYLFSGKPFAIVAMGRTSERLVEEAPIAVASYIINETMENLQESLDELLVSDPLAEQRLATRRYYLGPFEGDYAEGFLTAARRQIDRAPSAAMESYAYAGE